MNTKRRLQLFVGSDTRKRSCGNLLDFKRIVLNTPVSSLMIRSSYSI